MCGVQTWPVIDDVCTSICLLYFRLDVCFMESSHTGLCMYDNDRLLNKQLHVAVTALIVFTNVIVSTLCQKAVLLHALHLLRLGRGRHIHCVLLTSNTENCLACTIIGLPTRQTQVTAIHMRRQQVATLCAILLHPTDD